MHDVLILQLSNSNILARSSGSSRRAAVSSSRDAFAGSESDLHRSRAAEASPGAAYRISSGQRSSPIGGSSETKRTLSGRNTSHIRNFDGALKGIESLQLDNEEKVHY